MTKQELLKKIEIQLRTLNDVANLDDPSESALACRRFVIGFQKDLLELED